MKKSIMALVAVILVLSVAVWPHFYRQKAGQIGVLFRGYQLESIASTGGQVETNPETLQTLSGGALQPGHACVFRKVAKRNDVKFARYRLPIRPWLAHCRVVSVGKPAVVFAGQPVFPVEYECGEHRGVISNRLVETSDQNGAEAQLVVTLQ
jgi:hypothetical protein